MSEQAVNIIVAIIAALGGGGIGAAIIAAIANRKKTDSEALAIAMESLSKTATTLMEISETRIKNLCERVAALELKAEAREEYIDTQQKEIVELRGMVDKLTTENAKLRAENINLTRRLRDVETKLRGLTGLVDHDGSSES